MVKLLLIGSSLAFFTLLSAGVLAAFLQGKILVERRMAALRSGIDSVPANEEPDMEALEDETEKKSLTDRIVKPLWQKFGIWMLAAMSVQKAKVLEKKLADAGRPYHLTAVDFRLTQLVLAASFFLFVSLVFLPLADEKKDIVMLSVAAALFGYAYPNYYLAARKRQRIRELQKMMPDFFDMVNVSIEAGMGLDMALSKVARRMEGPLSDEFLRALEDMKLGNSRKEAFSALRNRVPLEHFQSVMSAIIQADQLGIGMAKVIRAQTHRIREHRRQAAKEQAMKAPVKMMIPMVLFMFPTLFIVLLGPVIVRLVSNWL